MATIKELAEPLAIKVLRNRLNHTHDSLSGQPTAIVPIAIATIPPGTQSTAITPQLPAASIPQQAAPTATQ